VVLGGGAVAVVMLGGRARGGRGVGSQSEIVNVYYSPPIGNGPR